MSTPIPPDHPGNNLSVGLLELSSQLIKLNPVILPNQLNNDLDLLRVSYNYLYVCNWLFNFRNYLKIQNVFDIDLFEMELLKIHPSTDLIEKLKTNISNYFKCENIEQAYNSLKYDEITHFDSLSVEEKINVIYKLLWTMSKYSKFRNWAETVGLEDDLRLDPIADDYFLLFDNRLYKRKVDYNVMQIPKKRKLTTEIPDSKFDVKEVKFELIFKNIYECDEFMQNIKKSNRPLYNALNRSVDYIIDNEIKKRKYLMSKRKESQIVNLLATRKRSSRLEARESKRKEEEEQLRLQEEEDSKFASERRFERRLRMKDV